MLGSYNIAILKNQILNKGTQSGDIRNIKAKQDMYGYLLYIILLITSLCIILLEITNQQHSETKKVLEEKRRVIITHIDTLNHGQNTSQGATSSGNVLDDNHHTNVRSPFFTITST